jgi:hypothetical protein
VLFLGKNNTILVAGQMKEGKRRKEGKTTRSVAKAGLKNEERGLIKWKILNIV